MKRFLLANIFTIISLYAYSQTDKVITLQGDTLSGKVTISSAENSAQTITLKEGKDKTRFKAYQIKSVIIDDDIYHTLKINKLYQLAIIQKEGYLSLYRFMDSEESDSREFSTLILIKKDGSQLIVPNLKFRKYLERFLQDCDYVSNKLTEKGYSKRDLELIIDDYNNCIDENTSKLETSTTEANRKLEKANKIKLLISAIEKDKSIADSESIIEMLNELSAKIKEGNVIPKFLTSALHTSLESNADYSNQLNQILD